MIKEIIFHNKFICVLLLTLLLLTTLPVEAQSGELISIDSKQVEVGDLFIASIYASNFEDVEGVDCVLLYNPDIIEYVAAVSNNSNIELLGTSVSPYLESLGKVNIVATNVNGITVSDPQPFIDVYFRAIDNGTSKLEFQQFPEISKNYENFAISYTNGIVNVGNSAPVLDPIGPKSVNEGELLTFTVSASDTDGDELTYSAIGLLGGATFNETTQVFEWTPDYDFAGSYLFMFEVSDGLLSDQEIVNIEVNNVNREPVLASIVDKTVLEDELLSISLSATDADTEDTFTYSTNASFGTLTGNVFEWTPGFIDAGTYDVEFTVTDGIATDSEIITITVKDSNRAPELASIGDKTVLEDELLSISLSSTDADTEDTLTYSTNASFGTLTGNVFEWTPGFSDAGTYDVEFTVTDGIDTDSEVITITVTDVNRDPVLVSIGDKTVAENELLSIALSATDADPDDTLTFSTNATFGTLTGNVFEWTPGFDDAGDYDVEFTVTDGIATDSEVITITVTDVNRDPVLAAIGDKTVAENELLSIVLSSTDADPDDTLTFSTNASFGTLTGNVFEWTPGFDDAGDYDVEFTVTDGIATDSEIITITVTDVNRDPVLAAIGDKTVLEDELLSITLSSTDADPEDTLTYSTNASFGTLTGNVFEWTPGFSDAGDYDVEFTVTDGIATDSEIITITVKDSNRAPELAAIGDKTVVEDELLSITLSSTDADPEDTLTFSTNATFGTLTGNVFEWTPGFDDAGDYDVEFTVTDGIATDSEVITITVTDVNRDPVLAAIGDKTVAENELLSIALSSTDADPDDTLTFSTNATFGTLTGNVFDWTPGFDDAGDYDVEFTVTDGIATDSEIITITVTDVNRAPELAAIGDKTVAEDELLSIALSSTDADGDSLTYSTNATFGTLTGNVFKWTPGFGEAGEYYVEFTVTDGIATDSEIITITVTDVNRSPELDAIGDKTVAEDELLSITLSATEADGDSLTYSTNATFGTLTGNVFDWTPGFDDAGEYDVEFAVTDGIATDYEVITITVTDVNRAPELGVIGGQTVAEDELLSITMSATDADGDSLTYSTNATFGTLTGNVFDWTPGSDDAGEYDVEFTVTDGIATDSEIITITVTDVNRAPELAAIGDKTVAEDELLSITMSATDADGDSLTYSTNATFGTLTGNVFDWTPGFDDAGEYDVEFTVTDGIATDSEVITITVTDVNRAPELGVIGGQTVAEDELLSITMSATDADGDSLTYSTNATFGTLTGNVFDWTPGFGEAGEYDVEFAVTDGIATTSEVITITVKEVVKILPVADFTADVTSGNAPLIVQFTDQSSNALTWSWDVDGDGVEDGNTRDFSYTYLTAGTYDVSLKVANSDGTDIETKADYITVTEPQEILISITDNVEKSTLGAELTYEVTLTNTKSIPLTNVEIVDSLPSSLEFISASGTIFDETTNTVILEMGALLPGETKTAQITVRTTAFGPIENAVTMICEQQETATCKDLTTVVTQEEIPEFPTIALPMLVVLGLAFVFMRRRE